MIYTIECYKKTGFNGVNAPESLAWLRKNFASFTVPSIDVLQNEGLTSVNVRSTWEQMRDVDYVVIGDECYAAEAVPTMTSEDVVTLALTEDPLTSEGGAAAQTYLDGLTERHTVSDDTMYKYTQDDPYMTPNETLKLVTSKMLFAGTDADCVAVESTIDLQRLGAEFDDEGNLINGKGITFKDRTSENGESVTVPYTEGVTGRTAYVLGDETKGILAPNTRLYTVYKAGEDYPKIVHALAGIRALGVESALISQVQYPSVFVESIVGTDGQFSTVRGKDQTISSGLPVKYSTGYKNNRLFYGEYNKYGLITASGAKGEYDPEQIAEDGEESPQVRSIADPRPDGRPYFRFASYMGDTSRDLFFMNAVSGLQWQNVPLTYTSPSGSYMTQENFDSTRRSDYNENQHKLRAGYSSISPTGGSLVGVATQLFDDAAAGLAKTIVGAGSWLNSALVGNPKNPGFISDYADYNKYMFDLGDQRYTNDQYRLARNRELLSMGVSMKAVAPSVYFPFTANIVRDFVGNGVVVYKYEYSTNDLKRIDKILTMYGYKDTVPITKEIFSAREKFDYVQASGVTIGGDIPMWKRQMMADQLSAGIRIWHVKPTPEAYEDNPIRSTDNG